MTALVQASELAALIKLFSHAEVAEVLRLIASRVASEPEIDDFDAAAPTEYVRPPMNRFAVQLIVHQAYQEAGFVVADLDDGSVGILNASPQIVGVTNRIIDLVVQRFSPLTLPTAKEP